MSNPSPLKITVIGCGYWGKNLIRNFSDLGALGGVCDVDPDRAAEMSNRYSVPAVPFDAAVCDGDAPAVVIAAPAELQYPG